MCSLLNESVKISVAFSQIRRFTQSSKRRASFSLALFRLFFVQTLKKFIDLCGFSVYSLPKGRLASPKRQCLADFSQKRQSTLELGAGNEWFDGMCGQQAAPRIQVRQLKKQ
jgi:hypothetical protein